MMVMVVVVLVTSNGDETVFMSEAVAKTFIFKDT